MSDALDEYLKTSSGQDTVAVPTTSTLVVPESDARMSLVIQNVGANPVFLSWRRQAVNGQGIRLGAVDTAGSWILEMSIDKAGRMVRGPIYAIAVGGASAITYVESLHPCDCMREGMPNAEYRRH